MKTDDDSDADALSPKSWKGALVTVGVYSFFCFVPLLNSRAQNNYDDDDSDAASCKCIHRTT